MAGPRCPKCSASSRVISSLASKDGTWWRERECANGHFFETKESVAEHVRGELVRPWQRRGRSPGFDLPSLLLAPRRGAFS